MQVHNLYGINKSELPASVSQVSTRKTVTRFSFIVNIEIYFS